MDFDAFVRWRKFLKPFVLNAPFLYPLKTTEDLFSQNSFFMSSEGRERVDWDQMG